MPARHRHGGDRCRALVRDKIRARELAGDTRAIAEREAVREARATGCNVTAPRPYVFRAPAKVDDAFWR